ncbi:MAG: site-specific integrase [Spirochaetaceae bacterium]|jgi:integrase|nr:site-specific integrase [Spirochaetaceae bacterium]
MRNKAIFSVFGRTLASGKVVYYYHCYDEQGKRTAAHSTGQVKKTLAVAYCMALYREGNLIPRPRCPTFGEYAAGWWDTATCKYLQWRNMRDPLSEGTILIHKNSMDNHILPYFSGMPLSDITQKSVDDWFAYLTGKKLKPASIHCCFYTLKTMMGEAVRRELLSANPLAGMKELKIEDKEMQILRLDEVRLLFPRQWDTIWDDYTVYAANKLAAYTGMRHGELLGLRGEYVYDDYIHVCGQYTRSGYRDVKTKESRDIPITRVIRDDLEKLIKLNGSGYVFSEDGGVTPLGRGKMYRGFKAALDKIGIDDAQRKERGITIHTWRHFLNTALRVANIPDSKVQKVTGHKSMKMTDHYTHFNTQEFTEVREVQTKLLTGPKTERGKGGAKGAGAAKGKAVKKHAPGKKAAS